MDIHEKEDLADELLIGFEEGVPGFRILVPGEGSAILIGHAG